MAEDIRNVLRLDDLLSKLDLVRLRNHQFKDLFVKLDDEEQRNT